jgi:hypothetical protein
MHTAELFARHLPAVVTLDLTGTYTRSGNVELIPIFIATIEAFFISNRGLAESSDDIRILPNTELFDTVRFARFCD